MIYLLILLVGFIIALTNILNTLRRYGTAGIALNPVFWFSIFFILIHVITPAVKFIHKKYRYQETYNTDTLLLSSLAIICAYQLTVIVLRALSKRTRSRAPVDNRFRQDRTNVIMLTGISALILGAYGAVTNWNHIGDDYLSDRISSGVGRGAATQLPNFLIGAIIIFLYLLLSSRKLLMYRLVSLILFLVSFGLAIAYYNATNSRNSIFLVICLIISIVWMLRPFELKFTKKLLRRFVILIISVIITIFAFTQMTTVRYNVNDGQYAMERRNNILYYMLDGAFGNDENVMWMMQNSFEPQLGETYLAGLLNFVPRTLWADKPLGGGPRMRNMIYPGSYVVGRARNSSVTTGLFSEAVLNFGLLGLFGVSFIWAVIAILLSRRAILAQGSIRIVAWATFLVLWCSLIMYAEFLGFLGRSVFIMVPLLVAAIFGTKRRCTWS